MERKLDSIQRVHELEAIPNADAIELAHINGGRLSFKAISKRFLLKEGD